MPEPSADPSPSLAYPVNCDSGSLSRVPVAEAYRRAVAADAPWAPCIAPGHAYDPLRCDAVSMEGAQIIAFRGCACQSCFRVRELAACLPQPAHGYGRAAGVLMLCSSLYRHMESAHQARLGSPYHAGADVFFYCAVESLRVGGVPADVSLADILAGVGGVPADVSLADILAGSPAPAPDPEPAFAAPRPRPELAIPRDALTCARFGVEIECLARATRAEYVLQDTACALVRAGVPACAEGYHHETRPHWRVTTDGSVRCSDAHPSHYPVEIVSPIERSLAPVELALRAIAPLARVNRSCGFHVHFDAADFSGATWVRLFSLYSALEPALDAIMPPSRRGNANRYCQSVIRDYTGCCHRRHIAAFHDGSRYLKLNPMAWERHRTVEFRHHGATANPVKAVSWIRLCDQLVAWALDESRAIPRAADMPAAPIAALEALFGYLVAARREAIASVGYTADPPSRLSSRQHDLWRSITDALAGATPRPTHIADVRRAAIAAVGEARLASAVAHQWADAVALQTVDSIESLASHYLERAAELAQDS